MKTVYFFILCNIFLYNGFSQNVDSLFIAGNNAYNEGNYQKSIGFYTQILNKKFESAELYFNLGNAHYKLSNVPESIYYFEKSKKLNPKNKEVVENLTFAKNMRLDEVEVLPKSQIALFQENIYNKMNSNQWVITSIVLAWLSCLFFVFFRLNNIQTIKRVFFSSSIICLLLFIFSLQINQQIATKEKTTQAIIFSPKVEIRTEPNHRSEVKIELHAGIKTTILDSLPGWKKVKLINGLEGWIEELHLKEI